MMRKINKQSVVVLVILSHYFIQGVLHNLGHVVTPTLVNQLGIPSFMFGFFFAAMSLGMFIGAPLWGVLGDARLKKPFIVLGLLLYSVGQVFFVISENLVLMTLARFLSGFGVSAFITLMLAHLIGHVSVKERTKYISLSVALFALGVTLGYQLGGIMGDYFIKEVFYIQAALNTVWVGYIAITMKEKHITRVEGKRHFFQHFKEATTLEPSLLLFLIGLTTATMSASVLTKYFDVYMIDLGYSPRELGTFVMVTGFVGLFTNFVLVPLLSKLRKDMTIMLLIQLISAVVVLIVFRNPNFILMIYTVFLIYHVMKSMFQPFEQNYISLHAPKEKHASILGVRHAFFSIGMVIGPLVSGFIYDHNPIRVFDFSVLMFLIAFVLMFVSHKLQSKPKPVSKGACVSTGEQPWQTVPADHE